MSKWDLQPRFRKKPEKVEPPKPKGELCRVLPPRLSRTPSIVEYLLSKLDSARFERNNLTMVFRRRCADLADLLKSEKIS